MNYFIEFGYFGLFVSAFLAATILPLSSEVVLSALLINDWSPMWLVIVATLGNVLGSVVNYGVGIWANASGLHKWFKLSEQSIKTTELRFKKYGLASLLLAWVPIIGDPITIVAGVLRINFGYFLVLVTLGKLARYWVIAYGITFAF